MPCTIGVDFGTESARAVLVDVADGRVLSTSTYSYPHGVIDRNLPGTGLQLPPDWALQHPKDWLDGLEFVLKAVAVAGPPGSVVGVGVSFTSCTVMPTDADGTPLCLHDDFRGEPNAWPKIWKHHAAQLYADRINETAMHPNGRFLQFYGGRSSSEWSWAKAWQVLAEAPVVVRLTARWIEGGDWIVWQLIGAEVRSACQAGYKAFWQKDVGYPAASFWATLHPDLPQFLDKLGPPPQPIGTRAGGLSAGWARKTGLREGTPVAVAVIDAHAGMPAIGVSAPGTLVAIMGTSTCHLLIDPRRQPVRGIAGVVEDGILPGTFGYEAGQASVGDIFNWYVHTGVPAAYAAAAGGDVGSIYARLETDAARLPPGGSGLLALDWWSGCRTPLVDAELSGLLVGLTVTTEPHEIYRALLESTAFGTRRVIETFETDGLSVMNVNACGGLAVRNALLMQLTADITSREVLVAPVPHASAVGAAIHAAAAADEQAGGWATMAEAIAHMGSGARRRYVPRAEARSAYEELYGEYMEVARLFAGGSPGTMKRLRRLRRRAQG